MLLDEGATRDVVILETLNTPELLNSCEGRDPRRRDPEHPEYS